MVAAGRGGEGVALTCFDIRDGRGREGERALRSTLRSS